MSTPSHLTVSLGKRSYDIVIGGGILAQAGSYIAPLLPYKRAIIVTDAHVAKLHLGTLQASLKEHGVTADAITLSAGEKTKSFSVLAQLMEQILERTPDRKTVLIALGGGVIGDITGFAASILLRGVDFIQIPTTLLAQVDSSVGGKTGINTSQGKNLVGSFHQPRLVLADVGVLATLPERELLAGYAEIVKYGLINDKDFFCWLEEHGKTLLAESKQHKHPNLTQAVLKSCQSKAAIVAADEQEKNDKRALLNLGHTFGHALEAETGFSDKLLHGEAVAIGMVMAAEFSEYSGLCEGISARLAEHLKTVGLPSSPFDVRKDWDVARLIEHFYHDKKAEGSTLTFILMKEIGQAFVSREVKEGALKAFLQERFACAA